MRAEAGPTLLVLGASGSLGRAVCAAAARLLPGVRLLRASRSGAPAPDAVRADLRDEASLERALEGAHAAIHAAGPYTHDPAALVRACARAGCHLVDLADRAPYLAAAEAAAQAAAARGAAIGVASGCSAAPALVEALAGALAGEPEAAALRAWFSVGSRKRVSGALLFALLRPLGRRGAAGERFPGPVVARSVSGAPFWFGRHPWPRAGGARVRGRALPIDYRIGMDRRGQALALRALAPLLGRVPERALLRACVAAQPAARWVARLGAERGCLAVEALDASGRPRARIEVLAPGGLDLAALPAVWAARALLAAGAPAPGPLALAELVSTRELAGWMRAEGWTVTGL